MKGYFIEVTQTSNSLNDWYPRGHQESYIRKGAFAAKAEDFFKDPAFWSNYLLYTSVMTMGILMALSQRG